MAIIRAGFSSDHLTIGPTSKAAQVTVYDSTGAQGAPGSPNNLSITSGTISLVRSTNKIATYRSVNKGFAVLPSATVPFFQMGNLTAPKTARIIRVRFSATAATGTIADFWMARFTAFGTGGSGGGLLAAKGDSVDPATALNSGFIYNGALPVSATLADGYWFSDRYEIVSAAANVLPQVVDVRFSSQAIYDNGLKALTITGNPMYFGIGISAGGTTPIGDLMVEWTES